MSEAVAELTIAETIRVARQLRASDALLETGYLQLSPAKEPAHGEG